VAAVTGTVVAGLLVIGLAFAPRVHGLALAWLVYAWLTLVAVAFVALSGRRFPVGSFGPSARRAWAPYIVLVAAGGIATNWSAFAHLRGVGLPAPAGLMTAVLGMVLAPVTEEVLFRGIVQTGLNDGSTGKRLPLLGTVLAAAFFGLSHAFNFVQNHRFEATAVDVVSAFAFGLIAGYGYQRNRDLWGAMLLHVVGNIVTFTP
jgi:membrane protease YdiL (CAAX protease family)